MKNLCRRFSGRNNRFFHQEGIDGDFPGRFSETGDAMLNRNLDKLFAASCRLPEPANLYEGVSLPDDFELPDNLLLFFHDFCAAAPNAHHRYTLVFPFAEMRYYVDQLQYDLKPGQMLLLRPYQLRFLSPESAGYQRFFITITLRKPQPYLPKTTVCELHEACYALLKQMLDFYAKKSPSDLAILLFHLLRDLSESTTFAASRKMSPEIAEAIRFISENLQNPFNNKDVALHLNMSESNLRRRFRDEIGQTMKNYIAKQRLKLAQHCLRKTQMRIEEVAKFCGYSSLFAFSHCFKHQMGISPIQFRNRESTQT